MPWRGLQMLQRAFKRLMCRHDVWQVPGIPLLINPMPNRRYLVRCKGCGKTRRMRGKEIWDKGKIL